MESKNVGESGDIMIRKDCMVVGDLEDGVVGKRDFIVMDEGDEVEKWVGRKVGGKVD